MARTIRKWIGFTHSLHNAGYELVHSPLALDENNVWRMDFEDMEKKIVEQQIHAAILCNPHNPTGRAFHGEYSIRMNLALPFARVQEAFDRLDKYVFNMQD